MGEPMHDLRLISGEHAVLLLHGLSSSPLELRFIARRLHEQGFSVHAPHIATYGDPRERGFNWQDWVECVEKEFETLRRNYRSVAVGGLCIGAVLALELAAQKGDKVSCLSLLSTTLAYDGWAMPWYRFLLPYAFHTPLRRTYSYPERYPYGVKNASLRRRIATSMQQSEMSEAGSTSISMDHAYNALQLIKAVRPLLNKVTSPALVVHAIDDETVSPQSAEYLIKNIGSNSIRKVLLNNSYHMVTIDNDREQVANEMASFIAEYSPRFIKPILANSRKNNRIFAAAISAT